MKLSNINQILAEREQIIDECNRLRERDEKLSNELAEERQKVKEFEQEIARRDQDENVIVLTEKINTLKCENEELKAENSNIKTQKEESEGLNEYYNIQLKEMRKLNDMLTE